MRKNRQIWLFRCRNTRLISFGLIIYNSFVALSALKCPFWHHCACLAVMHHISSSLRLMNSGFFVFYRAVPGREPRFNYFYLKLNACIVTRYIPLTAARAFTLSRSIYLGIKRWTKQMLFFFYTNLRTNVYFHFVL